MAELTMMKQVKKPNNKRIITHKLICSQELVLAFKDELSNFQTKIIIYFFPLFLNFKN